MQATSRSGTQHRRSTVHRKCAEPLLTALLVTNRQDRTLQTELKYRLGLAGLDLCVSRPRRVDAIAARIRSGRYDFVLAATGFLSHAVDRKLAKVCRDWSVAYIRVKKGRLCTCVRAVRRRLAQNYLSEASLL